MTHRPCTRPPRCSPCAPRRPPPARRRFLTLVLLALWATGSSRVRAGNDDGILIGSQAALTGGAITATVSDGTAGWYNPAGLALLERNSLDINGSVYGVNLVSADTLFTLPDGTESGASVVDWVLIPSALSYSRRLGQRVVGSFGVFMPRTTDVDLRTSVTQPDGTRWVVGLDEVHYEYAYVTSVGVRVTDKLRLGASLHGIYISNEQKTEVAFGRPDSTNADLLTTSGHYTTGDYGLRLGLGAQYTPVPELSLGLSLQTPTLTAYRGVAETDVASVSLPGSQISSFQSSRDVGLKSVWQLTTPLLVRTGLAVTIGDLQLMLDGSLLSSLHNREQELSRKWSGNFRLAAQWTFSERLQMGFGAFSDLNGNRQADLDYLGVAGGVRLNRTFHLQEDQRVLTFVTTLAGRYAYGFGYTEGVRFTSEQGLIGVEGQSVAIHAHELAFNLGGGVTF